MGALKFGLTLGLIGGVTGVLNLANDIPYLRALAAPGWYVATMFGKVCIGTFLSECSARAVATTIVAVGVGNGLVYAVGGALLGWGWKWLTSSKDTETPQVVQPITKTIILQAPAPLEEAKQVLQPEVKKQVRPTSRAIISKKPKKK